MVFQSYNLFPHLSVLDNITLAPRRVHRRRRAPRPRRRPWSCWTGSGWPTRRAPTRTGSPAASSSGWRSSGRWSTAPAAAARRGHLGARPGAGRRGAGDDPRPEGRRHDDGAGHPRDGLRPARSPTRCASSTAAGCWSSGPPEQVLGEPTRAAYPAVPAPHHRGRPALTGLPDLGRSGRRGRSQPVGLPVCTSRMARAASSAATVPASPCPRSSRAGRPGRGPARGSPR